MLKTILTSLLTICLAALVGCKTPQPPTPSYTCPSVQLEPDNAARNYKMLNPSAPVPVTTYTDLNSTSNRIVPGTWCYIAQAQQNGRTSKPSNTILVTVPAGKHKVVLSWKAPENCAGCTYILGRTAAIAAYPTAPKKGDTPAAKSKDAPAAQVK